MDCLSLLLIVSVLFAGLLGWVMTLSLRLRRLQTATAAMASSLGTLPEEVRREAGDASTAPMITIEILNVLELARKESWAAGAFGTVTPGLLRRIVYARALKMVRSELLKYHVRAEVRVRDRA
ncbi:MAG TPA: hypothetical protein VN046_07860 [Stenotrophobium sp.]|jgi:hypothetical protein|nr:hypothetical protein [Stenotrophobium sp.]